jgi:hypothetical protein
MDHLPDGLRATVEAAYATCHIREGLSRSPRSTRVLQVAGSRLMRGLKLVLPHSFEVYQAYTVLLHEKLEKLRSKLGLNPQYLVCCQLVESSFLLTTGKPPWTIVNGGQRVINNAVRLRFFRSKKANWVGASGVEQCKKHIDLIYKDVERIKGLIPDTREFEFPKALRQKRDTSHWTSLRCRAKQVNKSLEAKWARPCQRPSLHCASLKLMTARQLSSL